MHNHTIIARPQWKVLEILSDSAGREISAPEIFEKGKDVFELGSSLKLLRDMIEEDDALVFYDETSKLYSLTEVGREKHAKLMAETQ